jgi:DNA-directed RNA polymerase II subunit RPB2
MLPYVRQDVPIFIIFRALGVIADEDILSLICYDMADDAFTDMLKPSVEEGRDHQSQDVSLLERSYQNRSLIKAIFESEIP